MNLLGSILYDPGTAVNKVTTAAIALTALDTTNLRIAFTIPSHGRVRVRMSATLHGAVTMPQILLGVLEGSTVRGRVAPMVGGSNLAATSLYKVEADFIISGLTPGAVNWDAAYGVETLVAATGLKYGGPNNTTANDAFGAFTFEIWNPMSDPTNFSSLSIDANGRVDVIKIAGTTQTARDVGGNVDATVSSRSTYAGGAVASVTAGVTVSTNSDKTGYSLTTAPLDAAGTRSAVGLASANLDTQLSGINSKTTNIPTDPADASDIATSFGTVNGSLATIAGYLDTEVGAIKAKTDLIPASPASVSDIPTANITAIKNKTDLIPSDPADASDIVTAFGVVNSSLSSISAKTDNLPASPASVSDIPSGDITAIKAKTDNLPSSPAAVGSEMTLSSDERNAIASAQLDLGSGVEVGLTLRQAIRLLTASAAGKLSGASGVTIVIRNTADTKDRITATVDASGNRSAVTYDVS